jgi:DNA-binding LacI/PurR family transcriptional regulator
MEGFTDECGDRDRPVLWFHNKDLVVQQAPDSVRIATRQAQKTMLEEFALFHADSTGGVLFDEVWRDDAIEGVFPAGLPMVSFARPSTLPTLGSVTTDLRAGALLAISHLLACGYERIFLIDPLPDYEPGQVFLEAGRTVYRELFGRDLPPNQIATLHTSAQRRDFLRRLAGSKTRSGLICPEDNLSLSLVQTMREAGIPAGKPHGLVSLMGTSALPPGDVTCVRYDFRAIGRAAAEMLCDSLTHVRVFPPSLDLGGSTQ